MEEEKSLEISLDKVYNLPEFRYVYYNNYCLAIATDLAKWIVIENEIQYKILEQILKRHPIIDIINAYEEYESDIIRILTQIEAKQIENLNVKSIFENTRLHLHLTNKCNLHCPHCYMESGVEYEHELTTDEIKKLCEDFKAFGGTDVSLTGGEPTERSDFLEISEYINYLGMRLSIFTNGCNWDEEKVKRIAALDLDGIQVSIDGYDEETNSTIRGRGSFMKVLDVIDRFIKYGIFVKIAVTAPYKIIKEHAEKYIEFSNWLIEKYGNDNIQINFSYFFLPGRNLTVKQIEETKEDYYRIVDNVVKNIYKNIDEEAFISNIIDCKYDSCGYGGLNIMANGDIYFCDRITDVIKSGNIRTMEFSEIINIMKIAEKNGKIDNFRPCNACELKYICGGGCRVEYFKEFTLIDDIRNVDFASISPRKCDKKKKEQIYELMINTNERLFL